MYCIEECTCNIAGTFQRPPVIRRPVHCFPFASLITALPIHSSKKSFMIFLAALFRTTRSSDRELGSSTKAGVSKPRPTGQIRPAKPFHQAREDILSIMKNNIFRKNMLIW